MLTETSAEARAVMLARALDNRINLKYFTSKTLVTKVGLGEADVVARIVTHQYVNQYSSRITS
jgi:hypothetical protein